MKTTLKLGSRRVGFGVLAALVAAGAAAACQNTSVGANTTGTGGMTTGPGAGGATTTGTGGSTSTGTGGYTPQGCSFNIKPRPEYKNWKLSAATVGATPNIRRVRLGLGGNIQGTVGRADPSTEFGVAWQTDTGTDVSEIEWGTTADATTWPMANRASGITWDTPGVAVPEHMHEVYVCGLKPSTTYYYRVGGGPMGSEVWSNVFSFTTTPAGGDLTATVKIAITGDSRGEYNNAWQILQRKLKTLAPNLALFSGDVLNIGTDQTEWEEWLDRAEVDSDMKTTLTLPSLLTLEAHGNHDNHTPLFFGNVVLPQDNVKYGQYGELFFSLDVGPVHIIVIDDLDVVTTGIDANYQPILQGWLNADLTAAVANRAKVPWIIATHHHPEYSSSLHGMDTDVLRGRQFFAPIWQKYHVDMVFNGHDHDYERSQVLTVGSDVDTPMTGTDATKGTVYVVCAGSGADGYAKGNPPAAFTAMNWDFTQNGALGDYAILTLTAHSLTLEPHQLEADGSDPLIEPAFTIMK
jgi:hypothetical protein